MNKCYLGIDVGSISTKGVIIDKDSNIIASGYIWTEGNPLKAVKELLKILKKEFDDKEYTIVGVGTTGSARRMVGAMVGAVTIKNEITAHAVGTISRYPDVKTILEIGGQDSKIIIIRDGIVVDYAMNTLCAAGTGAFLSSQAKRLGVKVEDFGRIAMNAKNPTKIAARCTVFAESDLVHKAGSGSKKEDIIAGLCQSVVLNYLNNVGKGKKIEKPIVFQGGVSKNIGVVRAFSKVLNSDIIVDKDSHLMGALGVALLAKRSKKEKVFNFNILNFLFETSLSECNNCPNHCEVICIKKNNKIIDFWGNRCERGTVN